MHERRLDLLQQQHPDRACELRADSLRLQTDRKSLFGFLTGVGHVTSEKTDEGGFASPVLTQHDNDFGIGERAGFDGEFEAAEGFGHGGVRVVACLVDEDFFGSFDHLEREGFLTETKILRGNESVQKDVDT